MNLLFACLVLVFFSIPIIAFSIHMKRSGYSAKPSVAREPTANLKPTLFEDLLKNFSTPETRGIRHKKGNFSTNPANGFSDNYYYLTCSNSVSVLNLCRDDD